MRAAIVVMIVLAGSFCFPGGSSAAGAEDTCIAAGKLAFAIATARDKGVSEDQALEAAEPGPLHQATVQTVATVYRFPSVKPEKFQADVTFSCLQAQSKN